MDSLNVGSLLDDNTNVSNMFALDDADMGLDPFAPESQLYGLPGEINEGYNEIDHYAALNSVTQVSRENYLGGLGACVHVINIFTTTL